MLVGLWPDKSRYSRSLQTPSAWNRVPAGRDFICVKLGDCFGSTSCARQESVIRPSCRRIQEPAQTHANWRQSTKVTTPQPSPVKPNPASPMIPAMLMYFSLPNPHRSSLPLPLLLLLGLLVLVRSGRGPCRSDSPASCSSCRVSWASQQGASSPDSLSLSDRDRTLSCLQGHIQHMNRLGQAVGLVCATSLASSWLPLLCTPFLAWHFSLQYHTQHTWAHCTISHSPRHAEHITAGMVQTDLGLLVQLLHHPTPIVSHQPLLPPPRAPTLPR